MHIPIAQSCHPRDRSVLSHPSWGNSLSDPQVCQFEFAERGSSVGRCHDPVGMSLDYCWVVTLRLLGTACGSGEVSVEICVCVGLCLAASL